jgi:hypothetical protein
VVLVKIDVVEERYASIIRVKRISELETTLAVTSKSVTGSPSLFTQMIVEIRSSTTSVLTRATRCHIPEDAILQIATSRKVICRNLFISWK